MVWIICFLISFGASVIGAISGIGGGILAKPVLDALGILEVQSISFATSCMVLAMATVSLWRKRLDHVRMEWRVASFLAVGSVFGGLLGRILFQQFIDWFALDQAVRLVQTGLLILMTVFVLIYCLKKGQLVSYRMKHPLICIGIGLLLGGISSFLGIGGGPLNIAILYLCFSMNGKTAAKNSLYIILCSQLASLAQTVLAGQIPAVSPLVVGIMALGGVTGALAGSRIAGSLSVMQTERVFLGLLVGIILLCGFNFVRLFLAF